MSLRFPYKQFPARRPIWSLTGRIFWPYPVITLTVIGPGGTEVTRGLLDTGATDTVFPEFVAAKIGIDLTRAEVGEATALGLATASLRYAEVVLRVTDGHEFREWNARVAFTSAPLRRALLGFAGFLQFFHTLFRGDLEEVELTVNSLYKGT